MDCFVLDDFLEDELLDNIVSTQKEVELITKARRRILEANKTAFIKYKMLSVGEFREILLYNESLLSFKNNHSITAPFWFNRILTKKTPLIYPKNLFD